MNSLQELIDSMVIAGTLHTPAIIDAFYKMDRKYFVPEAFREHMYVDAPLPIGNDQTISQPSTVAFMLEKLEPKEGDKVLDIGSGSGWTTALLCQIVGEKGSVVGLERMDALVKQGQENLSQFHFDSRCRIEKAGEKLGMPDEQFDRILASASADEIPEELFSQLKVGGILVIPVRNSIFKFTKVSEDNIEREEFYGFVFVPLIY
ncbi:protein-L-isoaspartate O-methyltransferase [Sulfurovum sp.]|uniref:protein-L-isoaspartate O-methyltransferase n=2 Tax=Sulfurovum sp. TaxID=1969726 RepID=UPI0025E7731F|nr:protein-L-isoaspartate O-methyltransferase [Sulfurovum sp.]